MDGLFAVSQLAVGGFDHNFSYLVVGSDGGAALVDPAGDVEVIRRAVAAAGGIRPEYILLTHSHHDHTGGVAASRAFFPAPVLAHPASRYPGAMPLIDGQQLPLGAGCIEVIFTPGHSADGVCFHLSDDSGLFTGDTLFIDCCGYGEPKTLFESLQKLAALPDENLIYSGHDYGGRPAATLAEQRETNPYLKCHTLAEFTEELKNL